MMFKRISLVASLLFFLLGTNVLANTNSSNHAISHSIINKVSDKTVKVVQATPMEMKKTNPTWMNYVLPVTVCSFIVIILGGYWFILRKKLSSN
jgi:hypothetical protein